MKVEKATYFFGKENPLSNWHSAKFVVKGIEFSNVEQFMMFCKAKLFKDEDVALKLLETSDPKEAKRLGRLVKGFVEEVWVTKREVYVERGCLAKFSQNPKKMEFLLSTEGTYLVEASPYDKIWGAGLAAGDPRIADKSGWPGLNLLGGVLERVRASCLSERMTAESRAADALNFHQDGTVPQKSEVFVFGSNLAGRHGKGSALAARQKFGAVYGQAAGRQGQSYGIATKDGRSGTPALSSVKATLPLAMIKDGVNQFLDYARENSAERFFVVRLGCDLAAWKDSDIAPMFKDAPSNCSFPEPWRVYIEDGRVGIKDDQSMGESSHANPRKLGL